MTGNIRINEIFMKFQQSLDAEQDVREVIRSICKDTDRLAREITATLQNIHHSEEEIGPACLKARELFEKAREGYEKLKKVVPLTDYYKYYDHWRNMTQRYCFVITLTIWLESGTLAYHEVVAEVLGLDASEESEGFHLDLEDYLIGVLMLCSELARLVVNSASRGEYYRVEQISKVVMEVNAGFRLLNLKNDSLRKRFDALKYDVKKIEEVVYDLSLRDLLIKSEALKAQNEGNVQEISDLQIENNAQNEENMQEISTVEQD